MAEFTIVERTEPLTLDEVFSFIDDTNISKRDAHELKSMIADAVRVIREKAIDEFAERLKLKYPYFVEDVGFVEANKMLHSAIDEIAEEMRGAE